MVNEQPSTRVAAPAGAASGTSMAVLATSAPAITAALLFNAFMDYPHRRCPGIPDLGSVPVTTATVSSHPQTFVKRGQSPAGRSPTVTPDTSALLSGP